MSTYKLAPREGTMADRAASRVDAERRSFNCIGCGLRIMAPGRAPMGWLRVSALVEDPTGVRPDDRHLLALCCSTACLVVYVTQLDRQARAGGRWPVAELPAQLRAQVIDAALRVLEDEGLVVPPRSLLEMSCHELRELASAGLAQSYALLWLTDRIASWALRPDESLVSIIKSGQGSDPLLLAEMARELCAVGIHDLDDWLPVEKGEPPGDA